MTDAEKATRIAEAMARYRSQIKDIQKEFQAEIDNILKGIRSRKLKEIEKKINTST